jgi:hypothetical protein
MPVCREINPPAVVVSPGHSAACHLLIPDRAVHHDVGSEAPV